MPARTSPSAGPAGYTRPHGLPGQGSLHVRPIFLAFVPVLAKLTSEHKLRPRPRARAHVGAHILPRQCRTNSQAFINLLRNWDISVEFKWLFHRRAGKRHSEADHGHNSNSDETIFDGVID